MANSKKRCTYCKKYRSAQSMVIVPVGAFCNDNHRYLYGIDCTDKLLKKSRSIRMKAERKQHKKDKDGLVTMAQRYNKLQTLVNQYVTKVRDVNKGCCTCGKTKSTVKYDAGHLFTRKARPDIRFDLHNIHKQCSVNCNQHGSGMRKEYEQFIINAYGQSELDRLECEGVSLKEQFPTHDDIEQEIVRYRKLLRENNVKPNI